MPSFLNLTNYLRNQRDIQDQRLEKLHKLLFGSAFPGDITFSDFTSALDLSGGEAVNLLQELIKAKVLIWQPRLCDHCKEEIQEPRIYCSSCRNNISNQIVFHIDGCIEDKNKDDFLIFPTLKAKAIQFSNKLKHQSYMYYMLLDLAESENLQKQDSLNYNEFLENVRELMKREALSQAKDNALSFGEIGDCLKLAFLSTNDFLTAMEKFSIAVEKEELGERFPTLKGKETIFPRFDGTIGKIALPKYYNEPEKNLFCITLNGGIDFNDYELTKFFRLDHSIKTKKNFYDNDIIISLWVQEEIFNDLNWENIPSIKVEDNTHGSYKKESFGLLGFKITGDFFHEEDPTKYRDN
jgi:hypothetical protein